MAAAEERVGEAFYLTWHDWNDNGTNDHGLAIDDVSISAVPEPTSVILLGFGDLAFFYRRRR